MTKVPTMKVFAACPYCGGDVFRGYKHSRGMQKCYSCHRVSREGQKISVQSIVQVSEH